MSILSKSDFTKSGRFSLSINGNNEDGLQEYIDNTQKDVLTDLLGCDLYDLFDADLSANTPQEPQTQIYIDIFEAFCIDDDCGRQVKSRGMKEMLKGFTFWYYLRDVGFKRTVSGPKKNKAENSESSRFSGMHLSGFWNKAREDYKAIQKYICDNESDYPDYNGQNKETVSWA